MKKIPKEEIKFDNTSYIDPTGRVFFWRDEIFRAFYPETSPFYRNFLISDQVRDAMDRGTLVNTEIWDDLELEGFDLIVRHELIHHISYCFEWSDTMLKDAAVLTLDLCVKMCAQDILLQDASPYNIFFSSSRPVFIDLGSFVPAYQEYIWAPYQQFCSFFLFPLYLHTFGNHELSQRLLQDCQEGVSNENLIRILRIRDKLRAPGYLSRVFVPQLMNRKWGNPNQKKKVMSISKNLTDKIDMKGVRTRFFHKLLHTTGKIHVGSSDSNWSEYYDETDEDVLKRKQTAINGMLRDLCPESVLDAGCNTGVFSIMAARAGAKVVAFDSDHDSVSRLYELSKKENLDILPLVLNILNPSPGIGWRGIQYRPAQQRFKCDMVFALALMHHLIFTGGQDFPRIIQSLKDFQKKWLVVEYVDQNDPMAQLLPRRPTVDYSWYTLERFMGELASHFTTVEKIEQLSATRVLILATL